MFSEKIFRTYDIRGKAMGNEIEMDAEFALHFGKACASFLLKKGSKKKNFFFFPNLFSNILSKNFKFSLFKI